MLTRNSDHRVIGCHTVDEDDIVRLRIYREETPHGWEWVLDGVDDTGLGYSTMCWTYDTFTEAVDNWREFASTFPRICERILDTTSPELSHRNGQRVRLQGRLLTMWSVEFPDGYATCVWPRELREV